MLDNAVSVADECRVIVIRVPVEVMSESACPQHGEVEVLVREGTVEAQVVLRHTGMAGKVPVVRIAVVHVFVAVGIEDIAIPKLVFGDGFHSTERVAGVNHRLYPYHIFFGTYHSVLRACMDIYRTAGISFAGTSVHFIHIRFTQLAAFGDVSAETGLCHIAEVVDVAHFVAFGVIRPVFLEFSFEFHHFVGVEGEVHAYSVFKVLTDTVVPVEGKFHTTVAHFAQVFGGGLYDTHRQIKFGVIENVRGIFIVVVNLTRQAVVEEAKVKTDVGGGGTFPMQFVIAQFLAYKPFRSFAVDDNIACGIIGLPVVVARRVVARLSP